MCTMTWFVKENGYELFFNRDERKTRSRAEAPTKQQSDISYISPTDTDAGGTWIACNEFGITVCLLNYYQFEIKQLEKTQFGKKQFEQSNISHNWISRGEIVRLFATSQSLVNAEQAFKKFELTRFQAFRLFMIELNGDNRLFIWNGKKLQIEININRPKSSSSLHTQHVKASRYQLFDDLNLATSKNRNDFLNYHASHEPSQSAESVCMHRDDANTVSMSHIDVSNGVARFAYSDGSPCNVSLQKPLCISLVVTPAG